MSYIEITYEGQTISGSVNNTGSLDIIAPPVLAIDIDTRQTPAVPTGTIDWGAIEGDIENQIDLIDYIADHSGTGVNIYNSDGTVLADRVVNMNGKKITWLAGQMIYTSPIGPAHLYTGIPSGVFYIERAYTGSASQLVPFERRFENNPNGGPPDDNIYIQGWNIDSNTVAGKPSWTSRMEYGYTGNIYEYHDPQWSSADGSRTYRLQSFTFSDTGNSLTDSSVLFFKGTSYEFRPLHADNAVVSFAVTPSTGTAQLVVNSDSVTEGLRILADKTNHQIVIGATPNAVSNLPLIFSGWTGVLFQTSITTTGLLYTNAIIPQAGSVFGILSNSNDLDLDYFTTSTPNFRTRVSNNTGEWTDFIRTTGGFFRQFATAAGTVLLRIDPTGVTIGNLAVTSSITLPAGTVINSVLTGYTSGAGVISATDSVLTAIQKLNGNIAANAIGGSTTQIQYNNAGVFAGSANYTWDNTNNIETIITPNTAANTVYESFKAINSRVSTSNNQSYGGAFVSEGRYFLVSNLTSVARIYNKPITSMQHNGGQITFETNDNGAGYVELARFRNGANPLAIFSVPIQTTAGLTVATASTISGRLSVLGINNTAIGSTTVAPFAFSGYATSVLLTTPVNGSLEVDTNHIYYTIGGVRYQLDQQFSNAAVIGSAITGFVSGAGTVSATDTILQAFNKLDGNIAAKISLSSAITGFVSGSGTVAATDTVLQAFNKLDGNVALKSPLASPTFTGGMTLNANGNFVLKAVTDSTYANGLSFTTSTGTERAFYKVNLASGAVTMGGGAGGYFLAMYANNTEVARFASNAAGLAIKIAGNATAFLHLGAVTTAAGTAPLKLNSGTLLTTPETGAFEYASTQLYFTRSGTTRETVLTAGAVNTVSPTSPNRTIPITISGTTYYIAAKTTND